MKMKKLIAVVLCAVLTCFALSSCAEDVIGDYLGEYDWWKPEVTIDLAYDLYIISDCDDGIEAETSKATVQAKINQILDEKYHTTLNINYVSAEDYASVVDGLVASLGSAPAAAEGGRLNAGSIILVDGLDMYKSLVEKNALVDIRAFLDTNAFGKLNTQLTGTLLDSAKVSNDGKEQLFVIPNDHVIGEYTYTIVKRSIAEGELNFSAQSELYEMHFENGVPNELAKELIDACEANGYAVDEVIREVKGMFEDKALWEEQGYVCNISTYPIVTEEETFLAGFGILTPPTYDYKIDVNDGVANSEFLARRAMDVVYSINADFEIRNLLQYGVEHSNYNIEHKEVGVDADGNKIIIDYVKPIEGNAYKMNLLYTGDMFNAYYCEDNVWTIGEKSGAWTHVIVDNGNKQNSDSIVEE